MANNRIVGGRGSTQSKAYNPPQLVVPPYPVALPPFYGIYSPGVAGVGEVPATDAANRILNASTATLPTGWSEARSTTATYYNSSGVVSTASSNTLRNDYTSAGSLRGYLLEGAATNTMTWSTDIRAAQLPWHETTGNATVTSSTVSDPAGGTAGTTINFVAGGGTGGAGGAVYQQQIAVALGTVYTFSAWMRSSASGGASFVRFSTNNSLAWNTGMGQKFTLTSTWTRYTMTGVVLTSAGVAGNVINIGFDSREPVGGTWDNTIAGNVDVWGPQLELGSVATSYSPTTTAAVTRAADIASFTVNSAATNLVLTYDDGSVTIYTGVPPGSTFNVPTSSNLRLLYVDDNVAATGSVGNAAGSGDASGVSGASIVTATGSAAGSATVAAGVVGLSATDKYTTISVSADGLTATNLSALAGNHNVRGNTSGSAGKIFEATCTSINNAATNTTGFGFANATQSLSIYVGDPNGIAWYAGGYVEWPGSGFSTNWGTFTTNDVITWELLGSTAKAYKNGVLAGTATSLPTGSLYPVVTFGSDSTDSVAVNFGAKAFVNLPAGDTGWNGLTPSTGSVGSASGSGSASGAGAATANSVGASSGTGTATAVGASTAAAIGSAAGLGAATAVGASTARSVGAATGSGAATAVGATTARSAGASAGSGAATAASISSAVGSTSGTGSATAVGISSATAAGSAAGSGAATAVGVAITAAIGSAAGTSTASAVGGLTTVAVGSAAGSGSASATGISTAAGAGSATGSATALAFTGIVAQANGAGAASGIGASTARAVGSAAGIATVSGVGQTVLVANGSAAGAGAATGTAAVITGSAAGSAAGSGTASGVGTTIGGFTTATGLAGGNGAAVGPGKSLATIVGTASGLSTAGAYAPSVDFGDDFGADFANLVIILSEQKDFGSDFNFDFATFYDEAFNDDFGSDFAVHHVISLGLSEDFNDDFANDFAVHHALTEDFNEDYSNDFAVHHAAQRIVSGVGRAAGASIVTGPILGIIQGTIPTDGEPPPPVYPPPPPPVPVVWHPATEYRRVQAPRANRIYRQGVELRRSVPRSMKRRYG